MTVQTTFLEPDTEIVKRDMVLAELAFNNKEFIAEAREKARRFCLMNSGDIKYYGITGQRDNITSDDVRLMMGVVTEKSKKNNLMGTIFLCPMFKWTGKYWKSKAFGSKGNEIKIWRLA